MNAGVFFSPPKALSSSRTDRKTREKCSSMVSARSGCGQGCFFLRAVEDNLFPAPLLASGGFQAIFGVSRLVEA